MKTVILVSQLFIIVFLISCKKAKEQPYYYGTYEAHFHSIEDGYISTKQLVLGESNLGNDSFRITDQASQSDLACMMTA